MMTAKMIAEAAGVSRSTVQRALSGDPKIAAKTRDRVLEIARSLAYKPNKHARALVMRQQKLEYAVILTVPENVFMQELLKGINRAQEELKEYGVKVAIHFIETIDGRKQSELINRLVADRKKGIAFVAIDCDEVRRSIANGVRAGTRFVTMICDIRHSKRLCFVGQENRQSGRVAGGLMSLILPQGGKIACFVGSKQFLGHMERLNSFRERYSQSHNERDIVAVVENFDSSSLSERLTRALLENHPDLRGIFIAGAGVKGVCEVVKGTGLAGKVKMVTFDLVQSQRYCREGIVDFIIDQDPVQEGYRALSILNSFIMYGEVPPDKVYTRIDIRTQDYVDI
jgi:LacI family transcriptional regulator